jgi:hypothetical protein
MNLRTCSDGSKYDFQLTQDQVQQRCTEEHNKHKNNRNGWIYNTEHEFELPVKGGRKVRSNKGKKRGPYRARTRKSRLMVRVNSNGTRSVIYPSISIIFMFIMFFGTSLLNLILS